MTPSTFSSRVRNKPGLVCLNIGVCLASPLASRSCTVASGDLSAGSKTSTRHFEKWATADGRATSSAREENTTAHFSHFPLTTSVPRLTVVPSFQAKGTNAPWASSFLHCFKLLESGHSTGNQTRNNTGAKSLQKLGPPAPTPSVRGCRPSSVPELAWTKLRKLIQAGLILGCIMRLLGHGQQETLTALISRE